MDSRLLDERGSGGSRFRAPTSATSCGCTEPSSIAMRSGMPHAFPEGEVSGVLRSPWLSSQTTASLPARRAKPRIAPTCEQQHPPSTSGRSGRSAVCAAICSVERVALDHTRLRVRQREQRRSGHGARRRHPRLAGRGRDRPRTRVRSCGTGTRVDRDRGERTAVGTFRPQAAHGVCDCACGRTRRDPATAGQSSCQRRNTRHVLCPPKPNEFETPTSTCSFRALFGM